MGMYRGETLLKTKLVEFCKIKDLVIASEAKQSQPTANQGIASSLRSSQRHHFCYFAEVLKQNQFKGEKHG